MVILGLCSGGSLKGGLGIWESHRTKIVLSAWWPCMSSLFHAMSWDVKYSTFYTRYSGGKGENFAEALLRFSRSPLLWQHACQKLPLKNPCGNNSRKLKYCIAFLSCISNSYFFNLCRTQCGPKWGKENGGFMQMNWKCSLSLETIHIITSTICKIWMLRY